MVVPFVPNSVQLLLSTFFLSVFFFFCILAWKIPWTESLAGYSPWGRKESDTTKATKPPPERQQPGVVFAAGNVITNHILTSILMLIMAAAFQF